MERGTRTLYRIKALISPERDLFLRHAALGDGIQDTRVTGVHVAFAGRDEGVVHQLVGEGLRGGDMTSIILYLYC